MDRAVFTCELDCVDWRHSATATQSFPPAPLPWLGCFEAWGQWVDADRHRRFEAQPFGLTFWLPGYLGDSTERTKTLSAWLYAYGGGTQLFWASVLFTVKKRFNVFLASLNEWCLSCEVSLLIAGTSYYSYFWDVKAQKFVFCFPSLATTTLNS